MSFSIISNTENHKNIAKYVVYGKLCVPEELIVTHNDEIKTINYTFKFYKCSDNDINNKVIKVNYDVFNVNREINSTVCKYLSEKYDCIDTTSSFIDKTIKFKFLSITTNFKDGLDDLDRGSVETNEFINVIIDGVKTTILIQYFGEYDYSNGLNGSLITIKYKTCVSNDIDKLIHESIMNSHEEYEEVAAKSYPYYMTNLNKLTTHSKKK